MDMRLMIVSHVSNKYGAARSLLGLIQGLQCRGVVCHVVLPSRGPLTRDLQELGVEYSVIYLASWTSQPRRPLRVLVKTLIHGLAVVRIAWVAARWGADVLHTNTSVVPVGAAAAFLLKRPHIWHIREFAREDYGFDFDYGHKRSLSLINRLSTRVVVISQALKRHYEPYVNARKLQLIYNPVELNASRRRDESSTLDIERNPTLLIIGFLSPGKGHDDAISAVSVLAAEGRQVVLRIVGSGGDAYRRNLQAMTGRLGVSDHVTFEGYVDNPATAYHASDIVLVCSRAEAFGRVTVEAMLAGKPVVGARSGGTVELISEGFNGLLYSPGDFTGLARQIAFLLDHPQRAQEMGMNGFEWASARFSVKASAQAFHDVLVEAMAAQKN